MRASNLIEEKFSGSGKLAVTIAPNRWYRPLKANLHLNTAPTTSQNYTINRDDKQGTSFNYNFLTRDLSVGSVVDLGFSFDENDYLHPETELDFAYTNTDARTWGLIITYELVEE